MRTKGVSMRSFSMLVHANRLRVSLAKSLTVAILEWIGRR